MIFTIYQFLRSLPFFMQPFFRSCFVAGLALVLLLFTGACAPSPATRAIPSVTPFPSRAGETPAETPAFVAFPTLAQTLPTAPPPTLTLSTYPASSGSVSTGLPVVQMVSPLANSQVSVNQTLYVVAFAASANAITRIELTDDSMPVKTESAPTVLSTFSTVLSWTPTQVGAHVLRLVAYDANNTASAPDEVTVSVTPNSRRPTATIIYPIGVPQLELGSVLQVYAIGTDEVGVTQLDLWVDNQIYTYIAAPNATTPLSLSNVFTWNALAPGNHTLTVRSHDTQDQTTDSAPLKVFVTDSHTPVLGVSFDRTNTLVTEPISVTITALDASGIQRVELWTGREISNSFSSSNPARQTFMNVQVPWQQASPGDYTLMVRAYNADGNYKEAPAQTISVLRPGQSTPTRPPAPTPTRTRAPRPQPTPRLQPPPPPSVQLTQPTDKFSAVAPLHLAFDGLGNAELDRIEIWAYTQGQVNPQIVCSIEAHATTQKSGTCDWALNSAGYVYLFAQAVDIYDQTGRSALISGTIIAPSLPTPTPTPVSMGGKWTGTTLGGQYSFVFRPVVTASGTALRGDVRWMAAAVPSPTSVATLTVVPSLTATATASPTVTQTTSATVSATFAASATATATASPTAKATATPTPIPDIVGRITAGTVKGDRITFHVEFTPAPTATPTPVPETPPPTAAPTATPALPAVDFDCTVDASGMTLDCKYKDARGQTGTVTLLRDTSP